MGILGVRSADVAKIFSYASSHIGQLEQSEITGPVVSVGMRSVLSGTSCYKCNSRRQ